MERAAARPAPTATRLDFPAEARVHCPRFAPRPPLDGGPLSPRDPTEPSDPSQPSDPADPSAADHPAAAIQPNRPTRRTNE
jgi:hypothetical protein